MNETLHQIAHDEEMKALLRERESAEIDKIEAESEKLRNWKPKEASTLNIEGIGSAGLWIGLAWVVVTAIGKS